MKTPDDRILPLTRLVALVIIPFLIAAFIILYLFPDETTRLFAWTITPRMTPMLMGAGYIAGAYFFFRLLLLDRWHRVAAGFPAVAAFAASMGLATVLHWDRFNHTHPAFITWTVLYAVTPFLVFGMWLYNRSQDPGQPEPDDVIIPSAYRWIFGVSGVFLLLLGLLMFIFPQAVISSWPWQLTPLTARVGGGWLLMPAVFALLVSQDRRWSAARLPLESLMLSFVLLLMAVPRAWDSFDPARPITWIFLGGSALLLIAILTLYLRLEARRRSR
jgi:hypothetical protein